MGKNPLRPALAALCLLACGAAPAPAQQASPLSVPILFDNQTGLDPSQIHIQFLGGYPISGNYINSATGVAAGLSASPGVSYSLAQLQGLGTFNATTNPKGVTSNYTNTPGILVDNLISGRIYLNFGTEGLVNPTMAYGYTPEPYSSVDPNYATRWQYFEATIKNGQVWADLSYIDFTSISFGLNATNAPNGGNTNQISSNTTTLVNATLASATSNAASLPVAGAVLPNPQFARVISPQYTVGNNQTVYGSFNNYLASLNGKNSTISGLFAGVGGELGAPTTQAQIYDYTASFSGTDGNGTVTLIANPNSGTGNYSNIGQAIPTGKNTNGGFGVGSNITITLKYSDLLDPKGIYGSDPPYQVSGTVTQNNTGIVNDVFGRVVGDLLAGLSFGTVGSPVTANLTIGNGTTQPFNRAIGDLPSSVWWASGNGTSLQWIPVGDTLYSVAWPQSLAGSSNGTLLYGGAQPTGSTKESPLYNYYSAALVGPTNNFNTPLTPGYGTPFGDRIGNNLLTFDVSTDTQGFMILTINPDSGSGIPASLWTGGNGSSWDTPSNWSTNNGSPANALPVGNSTIQFLGTAGSSTPATVDVGGPREVAAISFRYAAQPFTLQNGTITLNGYQQGGFFPVGANIVNSSLYAQTIQNDLVFTANGTLAAVNGNLTLSGAITNNATLANTGGNTTLLSGNVSGSGGFSQTGTGTLALTGSGNDFTGGLSISNGTLALGANGAAGTGTITLTGGTLAAQGGNYPFSNPLVLDGNPTATGDAPSPSTAPPRSRTAPLSPRTPRSHLTAPSAPAATTQRTTRLPSRAMPR
jgi:autotransporter-associated beta strand protein